MKPNLPLVVVILWSLLLPAAQEQAPDEANRLLQLARQAYVQNDHPAFLRLCLRVLELRPHHPHPRFLHMLAAAHARNGRSEEAFQWLRRLVALGVDTGIAAEPDFAVLHDQPPWSELLTALADLHRPGGRVRRRLTLPQRDLLTEGVVYDAPRRRFLVSSVYRRKIVAWDEASGRSRDFSRPGDGLYSVLGMKIDAARNRLWACSTALPLAPGFREAQRGRAALVLYDLATERRLGVFPLPADGREHILGDLTVVANGDVYASDSATPTIYRLPAGGRVVEPFLADGPFLNLQGLDGTPDGRFLLVADYVRGIFRVDTRSRECRPLDYPEEMALVGIDGLCVHDNHLIAVQNGIEPARVVRLAVDPTWSTVQRLTVLAANAADFAEPTLGTIVGNRFCFVANSQWGAFDEHNRRPPAPGRKRPVILEVDL